MYSSSTCYGLGIAYSTNAFEGATYSSDADLAAPCNIHSPALTYDAYSGRFVLMYVRHDSGSTQSQIYAMTSTDGSSWTTEQNLGIYTTDAPSIACAKAGFYTYDCSITYARGDSDDPYIDTRGFWVNQSTGSLTLSSVTNEYADRVQRTPPGTVEHFFGQRFVSGELYSSAPADWAKGGGQFWVRREYASPMSISAWETTSYASDHTPALVASPDYERDFLLYVY